MFISDTPGGLCGASRFLLLLAFYIDIFTVSSSSKRGDGIFSPLFQFMREETVATKIAVPPQSGGTATF